MILTIISVALAENYCMAPGDSFLFRITDPRFIPVYDVKSTLNTNPYLDYTPLRNLNSLKNNWSRDNKKIIFPFTEAGTYAFRDL